MYTFIIFNIHLTISIGTASVQQKLYMVQMSG